MKDPPDVYFGVLVGGNHNIETLSSARKDEQAIEAPWGFGFSLEPKDLEIEGWPFGEANHTFGAQGTC